MILLWRTSGLQGRGEKLSWPWCRELGTADLWHSLPCMSAWKTGSAMTLGTARAHSVDRWVNLKPFALASYPLPSSAFQGAAVGMGHRKGPGIDTAVLVALLLGRIICLSHRGGGGTKLRSFQAPNTLPPLASALRLWA